MAQLQYDPTSADSILEYAKKLSGKSLSQAVDLTGVAENLKHKGDLGTMVERYFFEHTPPNNHDPDFAEAGVELKTTGVKKNSDGEYKAKERLVLTLINYMTLVDEDWAGNSLMNKCRLMLLLFYYYEQALPVYDRKFVFDPLLWSFPEADLKIIEQDWKTIQNKVNDGLAHELSEGDTFYLGACRKGSGGPKEPLKQQPRSPIGAKARAFSLKPSYINTILSAHATEALLLDNEQKVEAGLDVATFEKFKPYIGLTVDEISDMLDFHKQGKNDKGFYRSLTMRMLGTKKKVIPEFEKAGVELKTIRLTTKGMPKEDMSFPIFRYTDIVDEEWEDSTFFNKIEQKFFFVIFKYDDNGELRLHKVMYWNMPYEDREEAHRVWEKTKSQVIADKAEFLPKSSESPVAHVRPKGKNKEDKIPTPSGKMLTKKCFWLNKKYLAQQLKK